MDIDLNKEHESLIKVMIKLCSRCDGETMQYILHEAGQDEQMLKQMLATDTVIEKRFQFIQDDVTNLITWLDDMKINREVEGIEGSTCNTYLTNICIAADLDCDEPETQQWLTHKENKSRNN